jgi:hexosaminidase
MKNSILFVLLLFFSFSPAFAQEKLNLMPLPLEFEKGEGSFVFNDQTSIAVNGVQNERSLQYADKIYRRISQKTGIFFKQDYLTKENNPSNSTIVVNIEREGKHEFTEDESYTLTVNSDQITINSTTDFGAFHALETLYQLVEVANGEYVVNSCKISDKPRFAYRGLMLDVSRHFLNVDDVKKQIDLMSSVKLNVLHWHLADDQGFRVEIKSRPELHLKGSDGKYYTHTQIKDVISYASDRGIIVIPEIDVPGHASAILTAIPEIASKKMEYKIERNAGIFRPVLDPTNPMTYEVMEDIFAELAELFPCKYIHIGGDENAGLDWLENKGIAQFMKEHKLAKPHDLQAYFNVKLHAILKKYNKEMMGWEEIQSPEIPKSSIIHAWRGVNEGMEPGGSLIKAAKEGYTTVLSNGFYIDLLLPAKEHYSTELIPDPSKLTDEEQARILGGEATMWAELVTDLSIDSRIWPRTAAIAERLWSAKSLTQDVDYMYERLDYVSSQLELIGSEHIRNRDLIIRNISNNVNFDAVKLLVESCEPMKIYSRNPGGTMYQTYSPYTKFADAANTDAPEKRRLSKLIAEYKNGSKLAKESMKLMFDKWIANHNLILESIEASPQLKEVEKKSENLKVLGEIGNEIISKRQVSKGDADKYRKILEDILKEEGGRTELAVAFAFEDLI